jgi:hypothetical protein
MWELYSDGVHRTSDGQSISVVVCALKSDSVDRTANKDPSSGPIGVTHRHSKSML